METANRVSVIALILVTALAGCARATKTCAVCQRDECRGLTFRVVLQDGKTIDTCCPRCGVDYITTAPRPVRAVWATDFNTGKSIDGKTAVYVSGSDFSHCANKEARRDEYGCCYYKGFDRCQPSVVAFATTEAAQQFQKQHGGQVTSLDQLARPVTNRS